jgi:hypothetical protein
MINGSLNSMAKRTTRVNAANQPVTELTETNITAEETEAAASLKPAARSVADDRSLTSSKVGMMQQMLGIMGDMKKSEMVDFFNQVMSQYGPGNDYGAGNHADENESTVDMKTGPGPKTKMPMPRLSVSEDVAEMLAGQDLSEEFKERAEVVFEAAVNARVTLETARLEEEFEARLDEELDQTVTELVDRIDSYMTYAAENWFSENRVAVESAIRNEVVESFVADVKTVFESYDIHIDDERVSIVESLTERVSELDGRINDLLEKNAELAAAIVENDRASLVSQMSEGLTLSQAEKFNALVEGIDFDGDLDRYGRKIRVLRETYFGTAPKSKAVSVTEETFEDDSTKPQPRLANDEMSRYIAAINRTLKA